MSSCEHWTPPRRPHRERVRLKSRAETASEDVELDAYQLHRLATSTRQWPLLERAAAGPLHLPYPAEREQRNVATRLTRMGLLSLSGRGGVFTITPAGRAAHDKILKL